MAYKKTGFPKSLVFFKSIINQSTFIIIRPKSLNFRGAFPWCQTKFRSRDSAGTARLGGATVVGLAIIDTT